MADTYLVLIRHGQTEWNREQRIQGNGDSPLTDLGRAQAAAAAAALLRFDFDALYTSDSGRALQTATPIMASSELAATPEPRLRERHYGLFEGKTRQDIRREFPAIYDAYQQRDPGFVAPEGESSAALQARAVEACTEIALRHSGGTVAIVSHGGTIQAIARYVLNVPLDLQWRVRLENCGLTIVRYNDAFPDRWWLITLNEVAHLRDLHG